jgi:hypothetical protein
LWYGVKLFLSMETSTYQDFKEMGMVVFSIEDDLTKQALVTPLSDDQMMLNRSVLSNILSDNKVAEYWQKFT